MYGLEKSCKDRWGTGRALLFYSEQMFVIAKIRNHASDQLGLVSYLHSAVSTQGAPKQLEINEPVQADVQNGLSV